MTTEPSSKIPDGWSKYNPNNVKCPECDSSNVQFYWWWGEPKAFECLDCDFYDADSKQESEEMTAKEGWAFVFGAGFASKKAHYIKDSRSLCGRYTWFGDVEQGKDESPDNCAECKRRLKKLKDKKVKK